MTEPMASKEDLEEIIGEYSAKLGIPVPRIKHKSEAKYPDFWLDLFVEGGVFYYTPEALDGLAVSDLRVKAAYSVVGDSLMRRYKNRFMLTIGELMLLALLGAVVYKINLDMAKLVLVVAIFPLALMLFQIGTLSHFLIRDIDQAVFRLTRDSEGMRRHLTAVGQLEVNGNQGALFPKGLAKRLADLERHLRLGSAADS